MSSKANAFDAIEIDQAYFDQRGLKRFAGIWSLWALGVGAVISGHFSGWNYGLATGGWGGMIAAAVIMTVMFAGLIFCTAEMSAALPRTGASFTFARAAMGPWGAFLAGLFENVEYVLTPAVICFFMTTYLEAIFGSGIPRWGWWIGIYTVFLGLNMLGVALSFRITLIVTLASLAILIVFCLSAIPHVDFSTYALDIAPDGSEIANGHGALLPMGVTGILATLPYAVWLYLGIEELPLASEESIDPVRDMPKGIILAMVTLSAAAFLVITLNSAVIGVGSHKLATSGEPLLDGFKAIYSGMNAKVLGIIALSGMIASFHSMLYAQGRQIFSLSRAGYFPVALSVTGSSSKTPHAAMVTGAAAGLATMLVLGGVLRTGDAATVIGGVLLNMAVFGAMLSYISRAIAFIILRMYEPDMPRPYRSPLGITGAIVTIVISILTLTYQLQDPNFFKGMIWVVAWMAVATLGFALSGRTKLVLSLEETSDRLGGQTISLPVAEPLLWPSIFGGWSGCISAAGENMEFWLPGPAGQEWIDSHADGRARAAAAVPDIPIAVLPRLPRGRVRV